MVLNIEIEIPQQYVTNYSVNKFYNELERIISDIEVIETRGLATNYDLDVLKMLQSSLRKSKGLCFDCKYKYRINNKDICENFELIKGRIDNE